MVRLAQGDFERETAYETDPVAVAARFVAQGATWLHVVDLDGAIEGEPRQLATAAEFVAADSGMAHEFGRAVRQRTNQLGQFRRVIAACDLKSREMIGRAAAVARHRVAQTCALGAWREFRSMIFNTEELTEGHRGTQRKIKCE